MRKAIHIAWVALVSGGFLAAVVIGYFLAVNAFVVALYALTIYGAATILHFFLQVIFAQRSRSIWANEGSRYSVRMVVPTYREEPDLLRRCLASIAHQGASVTTVVLSNDDENDHYVEQIFEEVRSSPLVMDTEQVWLYRAHPHNGKRDAMYDGAHDAVEDLVVFMDSDTIISREDSVHRLIQPFHQGNVGCATGEVTVTNHQDNLLTRITNLALRKSAGCDGGRGSHSGLADVEHEPGRFGNRAAAADELPDRCPDRESRRAMDSHAEVRAMHRRNSLRWSAHFDLCSSLAPKDE